MKINPEAEGGTRSERRTLQSVEKGGGSIRCDLEGPRSKWSNTWDPERLRYVGGTHERKLKCSEIIRPKTGKKRKEKKRKKR